MTSAITDPSQANMYAYKTLQSLKLLTERGDVLWENYLGGFITSFKGVRVFFDLERKYVALSGQNLMEEDFYKNPIFAGAFDELERTIYASFEISLEEARGRILHAI
jgi:hypothetical protein